MTRHMADKTKKHGVVRKVALTVGAILLSGSALCNVSNAATLKPSGDLHSSSVYLSDLFAGLSHSEDRLLGPAPDPGKTIHIGGAQLIAFADQYGIDWDDQSSTASISLTRAGRTFDKDDYSVLIRDYVAQTENNGKVTVNVTSSQPLTVSEDEHDPVKVSNFYWDKKTNKFSADVTPKKGNEKITIRGTINVARPVVVFTRALGAGHIVQDEDIQINQNFMGDVTPEMQALPEPDKLVGMALTHSVTEGEPAQSGDIKSAILVHRNDPTLIVYNAPGIRLTATGRAVEDGGVGQFVHVVNLGNHMILAGKVSPAGEVIVDASSTAIAEDSEEAKKMGIQNLNLK